MLILPAMKHLYPLLTFLLLSGIAFGQDLRHYDYLNRSGITNPPADSLNHSSVRNLYPFTQPMEPLPIALHGQKWYNILFNKVFHENLLVINRPGYLITADPLFDVELGKDFEPGKNTWLNTRGFQVYGKIDSLNGKSRNRTSRPAFEFYTSYYESQGLFPRYIDSLSSLASGVPGQGSFARANGTWDHGYATGWARYSPGKIFSFELGTGRNFFGNGYRSMLLSDNARNYPYFRIDTRIWRIHYTNLWAEFQDNRFQDTRGGAYQKKYGAFHYLSYSITKRLELSFFESVIWQGRDSTHTRGFDINYLNPVIFYRPVEWTMGSPDNAMMGTNLSYRFFDRTFLYGQFLIDEYSVKHMKARDGWYANKYAGQIGAKTYINIGDIKLLKRKALAPNPLPSPASRFTIHDSPRGIFLQTEFNFARPYTFSHYNTKQNYANFSQPLAHPLGANFKEWVSFARIHWDRLLIEGRYSLAKFGTNPKGLNYGQNIFLPYTTYVNELGNFIGQGLSNKLTYKSLTLSYLLNPASLLNIFITLTQRTQISSITLNPSPTPNTNQTLWLTLGIRNSIRNFYYDN